MGCKIPLPTAKNFGPLRLSLLGDLGGLRKNRIRFTLPPGIWYIGLMSKTTRKIKAQSLRSGMTIELANGTKRKIFSSIANGRPIIDGDSIVVWVGVPQKKRKPGVYNPKTGEHWDSFEAVLGAGQIVEDPFKWFRYSKRLIKRKVQFERNQSVTVVC